MEPPSRPFAASLRHHVEPLPGIASVSASDRGAHCGATGSERVHMRTRDVDQIERRPAGGPATPKISVITVVRNCAATLGRTIESVIWQLGDDAEYVIVDGASTDGTIGVIKAYEDRLAHWVSEPDRGIYDAMNKALALARGEWVIFLGADTPLASIAEAAAQLRPALVAISAVHADTFARERAGLAAMARDFRVGLAGAGADPAFASSIGAEILAGDPVAAAAAL